MTSKKLIELAVHSDSLVKHAQWLNDKIMENLSSHVGIGKFPLNDGIYLSRKSVKEDLEAIDEILENV